MTDTVINNNPAIESPAEAIQATTVQTTPVVATISQPNNNNDIFAIVGFVISIFNLCAWFLPICGCPMAIIGIVFSALGLKSDKNKTFAMIGLVISVLALVATIVNGALGAYMASKS